VRVWTGFNRLKTGQWWALVNICTNKPPGFITKHSSWHVVCNYHSYIYFHPLFNEMKASANSLHPTTSPFSGINLILVVLIAIYMGNTGL
jgi:hypothetical protein